VEEHISIEAVLRQHAAGALAEAETAYRRILAADPQHVEAQHYLGVLLHQQGHTRQGISLILRALESDAGSASRCNDLGNILVQSGNFADAETAFRLSLALNAEDTNVWNNLGSALHHQKNFADAESAYRDALRCDTGFVPALNNLAALLAETGREHESTLFSSLAFVHPPLAGKSPKMLGIAYYRLGRIADAAECYRAWLRDEPGNAFARYHLAACTGENVPARTPDDFVTALFDEMAENFDEKLIDRLSYRGPEIIAALLDGHVDANGTLAVLDGGCGTGLCAPALAPYAARLTGVDLSRGMLAKARKRKLYDELVETELTTYLQARENAFDLVAMADTLIYFGDLKTLFAATRRTLRSGGIFAFTLEAASEQQVDFHLDASGRYRHNRRYVAQVLATAGLDLLRSIDVILRSEFGQPTPGMGVLARVASR